MCDTKNEYQGLPWSWGRLGRDRHRNIEELNTKKILNILDFAMGPTKSYQPRNEQEAIEFEHYKNFGRTKVLPSVILRNVMKKSGIYSHGS